MSSGADIHVHRQVITKTNKEVTDELLAATLEIGPRYKRVMLIAFGLLVLGVIGFVWRAVDAGFDEFRPWGYLMVGFAFLLTTASAAPLFTITQRMVRSHWRRPLSRVSEMFGIVGVLSTLMFIPLILLLPAAGTAASRASLEEGRRTIWFEFPGTPLVPELLGVIGLAVLGLAILYVSALPDMTAFRSRAMGWRRALLERILVIDWKGTERQWKVHRGALTVMGALYFLLFVIVHTIVASDFGLALVPGWKDAIFPAFQALHGLQAALASVILVLFLLHRFGPYKDYIHLDQFWGAAKLLLPLSLLWAYFWFSGFIVQWYGRQPVEQELLKLFMFQTYRTPFLLAFGFAFLVPFLILMWNFLRKSMMGPVIASVFVLFGVMFDKVRIYVATFSIGDEREDALTASHPDVLGAQPSAILPGIADIFMLFGTLGGAVFLFMITMKVIPVISLWEIKEGMLYRKSRRFLKTNIMVMGKPD